MQWFDNGIFQYIRENTLLQKAITYVAEKPTYLRGTSLKYPPGNAINSARAFIFQGLYYFTDFKGRNWWNYNFIRLYRYGLFSLSKVVQW